jgi:hypothetical protein
MGERMNTYRIFVGDPERKRSLRRQRHGWDSNIMMDLREVGWDGVDGIDLT